MDSRQIIPCEECLKLALCKHKTYIQLLEDCQDMDYFLDELLYNGPYEDNKFTSTLKEIDNLMNTNFLGRRYEY